MLVAIDKSAYPYTIQGLRGVAQLGLERLVRDQEVAGSNPVAPIDKTASHFSCRPSTGDYIGKKGHFAKRP